MTRHPLLLLLDPLLVQHAGHNVLARGAGERMSHDGLADRTTLAALLGLEQRVSSLLRVTIGHDCDDLGGARFLRLHVVRMLTPAVAQHSVHFVQVALCFGLGQRLLADLRLAALNTSGKLLNGIGTRQLILFGCRLAVGREADLASQVHVHLLLGCCGHVQRLRGVLHLLVLHVNVHLGAQRVLSMVRVFLRRAILRLVHEACDNGRLQFGGGVCRIGLIDEIEVLLSAPLQLVQVDHVIIAHLIVVVGCHVR